MNKTLSLFPITSRKIDGGFVHTNAAGNFMITGSQTSVLTADICNKNNLLENGLAYEKPNDIFDLAHDYSKFQRKSIPNQINYFIIIPTLRCNLSCSYCQVSRVNERTKGFDWNKENFEKFLNFFDTQAGSAPKIEIQGGEPTLIFDDLKNFIEQVFKMRPKAEIVLCTNLQKLPSNFIEYVKAKKIRISSSLDGALDVHNKNRHCDLNGAKKFFENLKLCIEQLDKGMVSVLPTISDYKDIATLIQTYRELQIDEIFLRPVNYQGFARKKHQDSKSLGNSWAQAYLQSLEKIFTDNETDTIKLKETHFSIHVKKIFSCSFNGHVDFRNPNPVASDYIVVNYDGKFYPSDEARMLSRIGVIDLAIGSLEAGVDLEKVSNINKNSKLERFEECKKCAYLPFCGIDIVDLISKHGTIDVNMHETDHCKLHIAIFDYIFSKIKNNDRVFLKNLNLSLTNNYSIPHIVINNLYD